MVQQTISSVGRGRNEWTGRGGFVESFLRRDITTCYLVSRRNEMRISNVLAVFCCVFSVGLAHDSYFPDVWFFPTYLGSASDPETPLTFYSDSSEEVTLLLPSLAASLGDEGILVSPVGRSPSVMDPDETYSHHHGRVKFEMTLKDVGFASIVSYEEVRQ